MYHLAGSDAHGAPFRVFIRRDLRLRADFFVNRLIPL
jgi:hypothetical protein